MMHCYPSCEGKKILVIGITVESIANLKNSLNGEFPGGKWFGNRCDVRKKDAPTHC